MPEFQHNRSAANDIEHLKVPPHSSDAEKAVVGGLMLDKNAWDKISGFLSQEDFYHNNHRQIFKAIEHIQEAQEACDVVTVSEWLDAHGLTEQSGGLEYLAGLAAETPGASNIVAYGNIVREKSILRQLIQIGTELAEKGFNPEGQNSDDLLEEAEQLVFKIREQSLKSKSGFHDLQGVLVNTLEHLQKLAEGDGEITGLPYGWTDLDKKTAGMHPSDLIIIAARPGMGKTTLAMNIAERAAVTGSSVAIFSMEMSAEQIVMRMFSSLSRINQSDLKKGQLTDQDWPKIQQTNALLAQSKLFINDTPGMTPNEMLSHCRRLKNREGLDLIVVDYLQLMQTKGRSESRVNEISEISRSLKGMAKELNVPVIALSQLSRNVEQRPNKRPIMSDLRESGAIEQDADLIMFIYRDGYYNEDSPQKNVSEIIIGKHRNGETGTTKLAFLGQYTRFENLDTHIYLNDPEMDDAGDFH